MDYLKNRQDEGWPVHCFCGEDKEGLKNGIGGGKGPFAAIPVEPKPEPEPEPGDPFSCFGEDDGRVHFRTELHRLFEYRIPLRDEKEIYFYHPDHLGSSSWITDQDGEAVQHLQYLPFGEPYVDQRTTGWQARHTFSGKERDEETGYSYFGARYYDSDLSVWLSVDPMASKYPSLSPYVYCMNNPIRLVDPNGMEVINGHAQEVAAWKYGVKRAQEKLDAFGGNKKAEGYKEAKRELRNANRQLTIAQNNHDKAQSAINDLKKYNPDLYNRLDNLQDEEGRTVDVHVRMNANLSSANREGQTVENYNSSTGRFTNMTGSNFCFDCIILEINPAALTPHGEVLSHEGGHGFYDVTNARGHQKWLSERNLDNTSHDGHRHGDPSGAAANREQDIYRRNVRKSQ
jgi:RHS repeat-associated protein